jgi:hypothetical protein
LSSNARAEIQNACASWEIEMDEMEEKTVFIEIEEINAAAPPTSMEISFTPSSSERDIQQVKRLICKQKKTMANIFGRGNLVFQKRGKKFKDRWIDIEEDVLLEDMGEYRCLISRNPSKFSYKHFVNNCNKFSNR